MNVVEIIQGAAWGGIIVSAILVRGYYKDGNSRMMRISFGLLSFWGIVGLISYLF